MPCRVKENWVCDDPIRTYVKGTCSVSKLRGKKRSAKRPARRSVHAAPDAWPIASYHVVCSPSRCPSRKSESGHRKPNSPYPTGHLLLNTPPTPALTADLGLIERCQKHAEHESPEDHQDPAVLCLADLVGLGDGDGIWAFRHRASAAARLTLSEVLGAHGDVGAGGARLGRDDSEAHQPSEHPAPDAVGEDRLVETPRGAGGRARPARTVHQLA